MSDSALVIDGVDYARGLPRGHHGIPPELVKANQCERLLAATTALLAEHGYAALRVSDVVARAAVSRATFYRFFDDRFDVVLAAQRRALEGLDRALAPACAGPGEWPQRVAAAIVAALEFCLAEPEQARLLQAGAFPGLEPRLAREGLALPRQLAVRLAASAERQPGAIPPEPLAAELALSAAISSVGAGLRVADPAVLRRLAPDLTETVLTPYLGVEAATRIALVA